METKQKIAVAAGVTFLLCRPLPAYNSIAVYECLLHSWRIMLDTGDLHMNLGSRIYFSGFVLSYVLFPALVVLVLCIDSFARFRWLLSLIIFLQILSWFFLFAFGIYFLPVEYVPLRHFGAGYYLFLLAYALLFWAHFLIKKKPNLAIEPADVRQAADSLSSSRYEHTMRAFGNPTSLRIVAGLFVFSGIFAAIDIIVGLFNSHLNLNFSVLCLWIGPGLLRHNRTWRTWALVSIWIALISLPLFCLIALGRGGIHFKLFGVPVGESPASVAISVAVVLFLVTVWQYRVLTRPEIRQLFE